MIQRSSPQSLASDTELPRKPSWNRLLEFLLFVQGRHATARYESPVERLDYSLRRNRLNWNHCVTPVGV